MPETGVIKARLRAKSPGYWLKIHVLSLLQTHGRTISVYKAQEPEFLRIFIYVFIREREKAKDSQREGESNPKQVLHGQWGLNP